MNKIWLIIRREYLVRIQKKSFIIMTIITPLLMAAIMVLPIYMTNKTYEKRIIAVSDYSTYIFNYLKETQNLHFTSIPENEIANIKNNIEETPYYAILEVKKDSFYLYSNQQISLTVNSEIKRQLQKIKEERKLKESGIELEIIDEIKKEINFKTIITSKEGEYINPNTEISMAIGSLCGIMIYIFIFMYGTMVMKGVIEEKTNRIVEIIISSIKPFQLMMGKIIGVALVGFTQFILWILLTLILAGFAEIYLFDSNQITSELNQVDKSILISKIMGLTEGINLIKIFFSFIAYFLGGYLLYSSLFASIGSAVDNESDTQQFILPITIPLIISFILIQPIIENPEGSLAFWMSIFPLTSPVIMMVRLPFGVENWEIIISISILIVSFMFSTWIASKIYRIGILMYGKKISYKDLYKWISY